MLFVQELLQLLRQSGERDILYTNCNAQYHNSIEEVCSYTMTDVQMYKKSNLIQLMCKIMSIAGFDAENMDDRPVRIM